MSRRVAACSCCSRSRCLSLIASSAAALPARALRNAALKPLSFSTCARCATTSPTNDVRAASVAAPAVPPPVHKHTPTPCSANSAPTHNNPKTRHSAQAKAGQGRVRFDWTTLCFLMLFGVWHGTCCERQWRNGDAHKRRLGGQADAGGGDVRLGLQQAAHPAQAGAAVHAPHLQQHHVLHSVAARPPVSCMPLLLLHVPGALPVSAAA